MRAYGIEPLAELLTLRPERIRVRAEHIERWYSIKLALLIIAPERGFKGGKRHLIHAHSPCERMLFKHVYIFLFGNYYAALRPAEKLIAREGQHVHPRAHAFLHGWFIAYAKPVQIKQAAAAKVLYKRQIMLMRKFAHFFPRYGFGKAHNAVIAGMHLHYGAGIFAYCALVIGKVGFVGGAHFPKLRPAAFHYFRHTEAAANFNQLPAADYYLAALGKGRKYKQHRRRVVVYHHCALRARKAA